LGDQGLSRGGVRPSIGSGQTYGGTAANRCRPDGPLATPQIESSWSRDHEDGGPTIQFLQRRPLHPL